MILLSVLICTHQPRREYLARVLAALKAQTLPRDRWELLLIDNASVPPLGPEYDLSWHPNAVRLREERIGKLNALALGLRHVRGEAIITVDDDNVLAADYLAGALAILEHNSDLGAFGGCVSGEFECAVPDCIRPFVAFLAINDERGPVAKTSRCKAETDAIPAGAGLVIRTALAKRYLERCEGYRASLGPGAGRCSLARSEDTDMVYDVMDQGFAVGYFPQLKMAHIIPRQRLTYRYMARLRRQGGRGEATVFFRHGVWTPYRWQASPVYPLAYALRTFSVRDVCGWWIRLNAAIGHWQAAREYFRGKGEGERGKR